MSTRLSDGTYAPGTNRDETLWRRRFLKPIGHVEPPKKRLHLHHERNVVARQKNNATRRAAQP